MFIFIATSGGCHDRTQDFVPPSQTAQSALTRALETWQAGGTAGDVAGSKPAIYVTDTNRKAAQKLVQFRILGETHGLSGRTYAVDLQFESPPEHLKVEYIVVGIDPIWVFRREDYELLMHWDHHMSEKYQQDNKK